MRSEDFARRAEPEDLPELMDEPCGYETLRACLIDLEKVNRLTGSYRPTLQFLAKAAARRPVAKPLAVLDVGCGYGDTLRRIARWAQGRSMNVKLTGMDLNAKAVEAARTASSGQPITWIAGDATAYEGEVDIIISSLVTHHMATPAVVDFLRWMEQRATTGWFVNDLERQPLPAVWFGRLAKLMRWHRFVQHDGPVSFRRAFREEDWAEMLASAGIRDAEIRKEFPARLCVGRLK